MADFTVIKSLLPLAPHAVATSCLTFTKLTILLARLLREQTCEVKLKETAAILPLP